MANRANISYHIQNQIEDNYGIAAGRILERRVAVSSAEILALNTTAKELVPAPGANKVLEFISATIKHIAGAAYVEPDAPDDCYIRYSGGQQCSADIDSTNFLDQTDDEIRVINFNAAAMAETVAKLAGFSRAYTHMRLNQLVQMDIVKSKRKGKKMFFEV